MTNDLVPKSLALKMEEWRGNARSWQPHEYQERALKFLLQNGQAGLLLDPGMGKTSVSLAVIKILLHKKLIRRVLVTAPLRACYDTWPAEVCDWTDFKDLRVALLHGPDKDKNLRSLTKDHRICIINPEGVQWLTANKTRMKLLDADMLITDECFAAGTLVSTPTGPVRIENLRAQDEVYNEFGIFKVKTVSCKPTIGNTVEVKIGTKQIRCTEDHPFFTDLGWLPAKYLKDRRVFSMAEVHSLRNSEKEWSTFTSGWCGSYLLEALRSESVLGKGQTSGKPAWSGSSRTCTSRNDGHIHPLEQGYSVVTRSARKSLTDCEEEWAEMDCSWREWDGSFTSGGTSSRVSLEELYLQLRSVIGEEAAWLSFQLQSRLRRSNEEAGTGSRWSESSATYSAGTRQKEREKVTGTRVESVSYLERGSVPSVYNIEVEGCPHFEVEECALVHNSSLWKSSTTVRFRALRKYLGGFKRRVILTGSPRPRHYLDLHGQVYLMDRGAALGEYVSHYRNTFFFPTGYQMREWEILPGSAEKIDALVAPMVLRLDAKDYLKLPKELERTHRIELPPKARVEYDSIENTLMSTLFTAPLVSSASARSKCCQIANGAVYTEDVLEERWSKARSFKVVHTAKVDAVVDLVRELQGEPLLLGIGFQHDVAALRTALGKDTPCINGQTTRAQAADYIERWNKGLLPVLLGHPASMGHSLNLQKFNARHVGYFDIPDNFDFYDQFYKRVNRQGNKSVFVMRHHFVVASTVDVVKMRNLRAKDTGQRAFLDAMKKYSEERQKEKTK